MSYFLTLGATTATLGALYALAAVGYTLIHAVTRQFHLAVGALYMAGAYAAFIAFVLLEILGVPLGAGALALALAAAVLVAAAGGAALRPFTLTRIGSGTNPTAPLVTTLGVALVAAESVRLLHESHTLFTATPFSAALSIGDGLLVLPWRQAIVPPVAIAAIALTAVIVSGTRFGRALRAAADDPDMTRLLGLSVERVVLGTFILGAALTGLAGALAVERYGGVSPYMGLLLGLKAIAAAVIGGIGSIAGAVAGGIAIAAAETFWTGYVAGDFRDMAVFALLVLALIFRPDGLFARPVVEPVSGAGGARR